MFNLEQSIAAWRRQMAADGLKAPALLDELESHLLDNVARQVESGTGVEQAFRTAVDQLGETSTLKTEFSKIGETSNAFAKFKYFFLTLAGIQNPTLATNMNSSYPTANFEPRWATYIKSAAFLLPAVTLWTLVVVFVFPKLKEICNQAGVTLPSTYYFVLALMQHSVLIGGFLLAAIGLLEWRSERWPRYRRAAVGITVFTLNAAALVLISFLVVYAVVAAVQISHHVK